ncbi:hypothetical protein BHQ19_01300 [Mycolicibacterium porcinum]|nr:hypothetical protein BHQ19_01300 [Mycolicibacterium porcinum]
MHRVAAWVMILGQMHETGLGAKYLIDNLCLLKAAGISKRPALNFPTVIDAICRRHDIVRTIAQTGRHLLVQVRLLVRLFTRVEWIRIAELEAAHFPYLGFRTRRTLLALLRWFLSRRLLCRLLNRFLLCGLLGW